MTLNTNEQSIPSIVLNNIAITGIGLNCIAGSSPIALFGAVGTHMGFAQPDPVLEAPALSGDGVESIMTCAIPAIDDEDPNDRLFSCLYPALVDVVIPLCAITEY